MQLSDLITQTSQRDKSSAEKQLKQHFLLIKTLEAKPIYGDL